MDEFLITIIEEYQNKELDDEFIDKFINNYKRKFYLEEYIIDNKSFEKPRNRKIKNPALYNRDEKIIYVYWKYLINRLNELKAYDKSVTHRILLVSQFLLHELEHANQSKIVNESDSLESKIFRITQLESEINYIENYKYKLFFKIKLLTLILCKFNKELDYNCTVLGNNAIYQTNKVAHIFSPLERLAEIKSYSYLLNNYDFKDEESREYFSNMLRTSLYGAYGPIDSLFSPTIIFLKKLGLANDLNEDNWYDKIIKDDKYYDELINCSFEKIIELGLPIIKKEHKEKIKELIK